MVSGLGLDVSFVILDEQIKSKKQEENSKEGMKTFVCQNQNNFVCKSRHHFKSHNDK